jgi:hypothetical protein
MPQIIHGPTLLATDRDGDTFRWRIMHSDHEQNFYVEIAGSLIPEGLEEPLRFAVESKGEAPLLDLLAGNTVPKRIRILSTGVFVVDADGSEQSISARWRSSPLPLFAPAG